MSFLAEVTPVVLSYNEEANIGRCLEQLSWARRVVLVDSKSTDKTLSLAESFGNVDVFERSFDDHASQWNFGLKQVQTPWVLSLLNSSQKLKTSKQRMMFSLF